MTLHEEMIRRLKIGEMYSTTEAFDEKMRTRALWQWGVRVGKFTAQITGDGAAAEP